ncbi:uncharacterized protein LOC130446769 isoform X1 [Diorhabda sublineata]|uniref:uncharacterized protein LOC130446769 isoform X1 n=2 Tax=Diorhabda sublineata TaxID=1163346 RepID=UPI0024E1389C|nr:uncharacterized protein LOC130446769 isoform X1 [Diorhabda sublineata]
MNLNSEPESQFIIGHQEGRRSTSSLGRGIPRSLPPQTDSESGKQPSSFGQQRSLSVTTLQPGIVEPRMAQLETLEAKMASIEVSLSSTPRRKKNGSISGISIGSSIQSIPKELAIKELEKLRNALKDKENIIQSLKGQLTIPGLRLNAIRNSNNNNMKELTDVEKKQAEARLGRLKTDVDNKRLTIKNLKMALERLDITDNIDVRIQQAELEYQLGREELNLLTLLEETRALQLCIEESNRQSSDCHTLYSCVHGNDHVFLYAIQMEYDHNNPKFGAGIKSSLPGLYVDWALEETNLRKGDRFVEVNGKIVLTKNRDDLTRLLAAAPDPAQLVVLRKISNSNLSSNTQNGVNSLCSELESLRIKAEEAEKAKEVLKSDNIRLTHRISYLEEQVSELIKNKSNELDERNSSQPPPLISKSNQNVTNINIRTLSPTSSANNTDTNVYKQDHVATEAKESSSLPSRSKSSLSNVSNTHIPSLTSEFCHKLIHNRHKHRSRSGVQSPLGNIPNNDKVTYRKHHHHHKDYNSESNSGLDTRRYNKKTERYSADFAKANSEMEYDIMDQSYKKATQIVQDLTRNRDPTMYEKHRQKCITASEKYNSELLRHYNARKSTSVLDFRSEIHIGPKYDANGVDSVDENTNTDKVYRKMDARSVKSLDFDSDCNSARLNGTCSTDYASEPNNDKHMYYEKPRPAPPKKPLRLSLHKTHSLQSVETNSDFQNRKCVKRNYKGEAPINIKVKDQNGGNNHIIKWNYRRSLENNLEHGSWC